MNQRDYQEACERCIFKAWETHTSVLAVMATGLGKTIVAANVIRKMHPGRTIFIAHREELIFQAKDKITRASGLGCEIEMADIVAATNLFQRQDVIISTVQTQVAGKGGGRMLRFNPMEFALLVIDEAHHGPADSFRRVIDYYRTNPNLKVLGLTATPKRADEEALGQIFQHVAFNFGILEGIENGWLVPIEQQLVRIKDLDFSGVRTTAGDLNGADLAKIMESEKPMQGVAGASIEIIGNRKALAFTASVKQATQLCEIYNRHKPDCADWVCGKTEKQARRDMLKRFAEGKLQIVCNVGCLTEGFDDPAIEVVVMARPTKSAALFTQMIGRGTRPLPGVVDDGVDWADQRIEAIAKSKKPNVLVVDFTGNAGRHKLITTADILGGKYTEAERHRAENNVEALGKAMNMTMALANAKSELQREREEDLRRERERKEQAERARVKARVEYSSRFVDPFNQHDRDNHNGGTARSSDGRSFSEKQAAILRRAGIDPEKVGYRQGQAIIGKVLSKPTPGQMKVLTRAGYDATELAKMGVDCSKASVLIDQVKANGWRRPSAATSETSSASDDGPPIEHYDAEHAEQYNPVPG